MKCDIKFDDNNFADAIFLEKCCHSLCKECIKQESKKDFSNVRCPVNACGQQLLDFEVKAALGEKEFEDLEQSLIKSFLDDQKGLVRCKCGNAI